MGKTGEGERLVKLMLYVKEAGPVSFEDIRERFPVEYSSDSGNSESIRRRFERDKRSLQNLGVFLSSDEDNRYSLDKDKSFAAPVDLTSSQISLLRLVCGALLEDEDYAFKSDLRMVLIKLGDELDIPDLLPQMSNSSQQPSKKRMGPQGVDKIRKAITMRKRLSFDYSSASGKHTSREVEPFGCFIFKSNCYVVAFDPDVADERCFRLDRMQHVRVNSTRPDTPDFEERGFEASDYYGLPFQFGDEDFEAQIHIDAEDTWRCDHLTMGRGQIDIDETGIIWTVQCNDTQALVRWCIEHYPTVTLVSPDSALRAFRESVAKAASALEEVRDEE